MYPSVAIDTAAATRLLANDQLESIHDGTMTPVQNDDDLDQVVAELIAREARQKNAVASGSRVTGAQMGSRPPRVAPTNTRFLNRLMQDVETHNETLRGEEQHGKLKDSLSRSRNANVQDSMRGGRQGRDTADAGYSRTNINHRRDAPCDRKDPRLTSTARKRSHNNHPRARGDNSSSSHPSKMDKYFQDGYDPATDVIAETRTDDRGLVEDDGWERALAALRAKEQVRAERKEEKRAARDAARREREEEKRQRRRKERHRRHDSPLLDRGDEDHERDRTRKSRRTEAITEEPRPRRVSSKSGDARAALLNTPYTPKDSMREWDKGKPALS